MNAAKAEWDRLIEHARRLVPLRVEPAAWGLAVASLAAFHELSVTRGAPIHGEEAMRQAATSDLRNQIDRVRAVLGSESSLAAVRIALGGAS